jgi:hypothetical protein
MWVYVGVLGVLVLAVMVVLLTTRRKRRLWMNRKNKFQERLQNAILRGESLR